MKYRPAVWLVIALSTFALSRPTAAAAFSSVFDTVDSVELNIDFNTVNIVIKGILAGGSNMVTQTFSFGSASSANSLPAASRCERLALAAISKPGKYQFAIGPSQSNGTGAGACKLILVAP